MEIGPGYPARVSGEDSTTWTRLPGFFIHSLPNDLGLGYLTAGCFGYQPGLEFIR